MNVHQVTDVSRLELVCFLAGFEAQRVARRRGEPVLLGGYTDEEAARVSAGGRIERFAGWDVDVTFLADGTVDAAAYDARLGYGAFEYVVDCLRKTI